MTSRAGSVLESKDREATEPYPAAGIVSFAGITSGAAATGKRPVQFLTLLRFAACNYIP